HPNGCGLRGGSKGRMRSHKASGIRQPSWFFSWVSGISKAPRRKIFWSIGYHQIAYWDSLLAIEQHCLTLGEPLRLVGERQGIEVRRSRRRIINPLTEEWAAVDDVDRQAAMFVLVRKVAPQLDIGAQRTERLKG